MSAGGDHHPIEYLAKAPDRASHGLKIQGVTSSRSRMSHGPKSSASPNRPLARAPSCRPVFTGEHERLSPVGHLQGQSVPSSWWHRQNLAAPVACHPPRTIESSSHLVPDLPETVNILGSADHLCLSPSLRCAVYMLFVTVLGTDHLGCKTQVCCLVLHSGSLPTLPSTEHICSSQY